MTPTGQKTAIKQFVERWKAAEGNRQCKARWPRILTPLKMAYVPILLEDEV